MPKVNNVLVSDINGNQVWVTPKQLNVLNILESTNKGGCASIRGYVPTTNYDVSPVVDIQFISRFSTERLYQRKMEALQGITFEDVSQHLTDPKLAALDESAQRAAFDSRKQFLIDSLQKTVDGDRSDSHRQGHDRCYVFFADGVKGNLVTEKGPQGYRVPVLTNGFPTVQSIMVSHLELNRKVISEGQRTVRNSGVPVLMGKAIERVLNQRSVGIRMFSLKADNFEKLVIDNNVIVPDDIADLVSS